MKNTEWISVKDRLPKPMESVLVSTNGAPTGCVSLAWIDPKTHKWADAWADYLSGITHWMPLPEPPKQ